MFQNDDDDFDFDEDFLKDADDKAITYYSQRDNQDEASDAKRRKLDHQNESLFSLDHSFGRVCSVSKNDEKNLPHVKETKSQPRKELVLGIFNKNFQTEKDSQQDCDKLQKTLKERPAQTPVSQESTARCQRRNLVLGILQKSDLQDHVNKNGEDRNYVNKNYIRKPHHESSNTVLPIPQLPYRSHIEVTKINSHIIPKSGSSNENHPPYNTLNKTEYLKHNPRDNSRKQLLLESMKPSSSTSSESIEHALQQPVIKIEKQPSEKVALVRKFPGPAGLLPDIMDSAVPPISYLKSLDENDNRPTDHNEGKLTEYYSQNTKNLFTEGAWQQMLDDLPENFLHGYEISVIKQMASEHCQQSMKTPFLAGILERIDHSHDNPSVILKDFTDNIQGVMHRDIPLEYPGLLEPNVVILLHNIGLLRVSGSLVTSNYCILISPSHLLGIYTGKGKIVRTPQMRAVLGQQLGHRFDKDAETSNELQVQHILSNRNENPVSFSNASVNFEDVMRDTENHLSLTQELGDQSDQNFEKYNVSSVSDQTADFNLSVSSRQTTDLENEKIFTPTQTNPTENHKFWNKQSSTSISKESINKQKMSEVSSQSIWSEKLKDSKSPLKNIENDQPKKNSLRSKLLQFKSNDVLTPPDLSYPAKASVSCNVDTSKEESKQSHKDSPHETDFAVGVLNDSDDDTDDDVMSQLDMDSLLSNYDQRAP